MQTGQGRGEGIVQLADGPLPLDGGGDLGGHVLEGQHEPGQLDPLGAGVEDRGQPYAQAGAVGEGGLKARRRSRALLPGTQELLFQAGGDRFPVEGGEDRTAEADPGAGEAVLSSAALQQVAGLLVVKEDLAAGIADQDPAGEFRHQGGETVAFLVEFGLGGLDPGVDLPLQVLVGLGGIVDDRGQMAHLAGAARSDAVAGVDGGNQAGLFGQLQDGDDVVPEKQADQGADDHHQREGAQKREGEELVENATHQLLFGGVEA